MNAAVYKGNGTLKLEDVAQPEPKAGEVLVKIAACGVCHSDLHYLDHGVKPFKAPPLILGHEASGVVEAVGAQAKRFKKGDRVLIPTVFCCGECEYCRAGRENLCRNALYFGNHVDGAYAQYVCVPERDLAAVPDDMSLEEAAVIADAVSTPYHAVVNRAQLRAGETLVVVGCGGLGINAVQIAAAAGGIVVAVDVAEDKLAKAKEFGASAIVNPAKAPDLGKAVRALTGGGADAAPEAIGTPKTIQAAYDCIKPGGRLVILGYCAEPVALPAARIQFRETSVLGTVGCRPLDYPRIIALARAGKIRYKEIVTHRFPLKEIDRAFELLRRKDSGVLRSLVLP